MASEQATVFKKFSKKFNRLLSRTLWSYSAIEVSVCLQVTDAAKRSTIEARAVFAHWTHTVPFFIIVLTLLPIFYWLFACSEQTVERNKRALGTMDGFYASVWLAVFIRFVSFGLYFWGRLKSEW